MNRRAAFTLIELLMVISIIIILAGLVLGGVMFAQKQAAKTKTRNILVQVETALGTHRDTRGHYPDSLDRKAWVAALAGANSDLKLTGGDLIDAWDQPIHYRIPRRYDGTYAGVVYDFSGKGIPKPDTFWLWSAGPNTEDDPSDWIETDGRVTRLPMGGKDDLTNWQQ